MNENHMLAVLGIVIFLWSIVFLKHLIKSKRNKSNLKKTGINDIDNMDGYQFERYLALLFEANGYHVKVTPERGDFGADLILKFEGKKVVVQAKRHKAKVGIKAIQEIVAAKLHYKADEAWVLTNSFYTKPATELALSNSVSLMDRNDLMKFIQKMNPAANTTAKEFMDKVKAKPIKCICGEKMIGKKNKTTGQFFYGCSAYPKCKHTKSML
ncbi:restriction endonuclease [Bacillus subtilis]|uniref:restriction endonuclease n=1 Tax=Bacillus subtilis TaxID=1423 RepID=UPI0022818DAA|nr:restriction endonuclease [Bacillus subtilis]MCY7883097.1 UTP--glucose-1-phosphate uridylyltransferase [Bacillus spizizenii]MCY8635249.1 UTP--glucose-1-phosphate uridylyltransferase [Bacillus spizizenii]MDO3655333.1 UTP--glucose-1-phosphate uridylyltransferase [Bacillus subtilis]